MINIEILKKDGLYFSLESSGHADYDDRGYDIVCAGVSTLTQTLYFYLLDLGLDQSDIEDEQDEGYLLIKLKKNYRNEKVQAAFEYMLKGLELLKSQYIEYIKIDIMEVRNDNIWFTTFFF